MRICMQSKEKWTAGRYTEGKDSTVVYFNIQLIIMTPSHNRMG